VLALNAASTFSVVGCSDPLAFGKPFEISLALDLEGVVAGNGILSLPGLPPMPRPIQPLELPRLDPVQAGTDAVWTWTCSVEGLDRSLAHPELTLHTPLRDISWRGSREGGRLRLALDMGMRSKAWTRSQAKEGMEAVNEDRFACLEFRFNSLTLN
jgi:hypothetical protein